ncbi:MAG: hypothetical protein QM756_16280 [Polyangiaceae bacterium]
MGLGRMAVNDSPRSQTGLDYSVLDARSLFELLSSWKVTHIAMLPQPSDIEFDNVAGNLVFANFIDRYVDKRHSHGIWTVLELPSTTPPEQPRDPSVLYLGCNAADHYRSGMYRLRDMRRVANQAFPAPREVEPQGDDGASARMLQRADYVAVEPCLTQLPLDAFKEIYRRPEALLYRRR